jgi:transcriptional repressor NrdR
MRTKRGIVDHTRTTLTTVHRNEPFEADGLNDGHCTEIPRQQPAHEILALLLVANSRVIYNADMKCPQCGFDNDRVIDSRASLEGGGIRRRRECLHCQARYSTYERVDDPIRCPYCHEDNNRIVDFTLAEGGFAFRRERECVVCRRTFLTFERPEAKVVKVIKKDGTRSPFDRHKIKVGLEKACWKRPISDQQLEDVITAIEADVREHYPNEVPSSYLGELVMKQLRQLDQVAFVRFASVYREFKDVKDFVDELEPMLDDDAAGH